MYKKNGKVFWRGHRKVKNIGNKKWRRLNT